jgi:hypothetical protein
LVCDRRRGGGLVGGCRPGCLLPAALSRPRGGVPCSLSFAPSLAPGPARAARPASAAPGCCASGSAPRWRSCPWAGRPGRCRRARWPGPRSWWPFSWPRAGCSACCPRSVAPLPAAPGWLAPAPVAGVPNPRRGAAAPSGRSVVARCPVLLPARAAAERARSGRPLSGRCVARRLPFFVPNRPAGGPRSPAER